MSTISKCMNSLSQGVYVIGSKKDETYNLMTAAWVTQVSANPNQLAVAIGASHLTAGLVREQEKFSLSVLAEGQEQAARICGTQSGRNVDRSKLVSCEVNKKGMPVVNGSAAWLDCEVSRCIDLGDHVLVIAEVVGGEVFSDKVLLYDAETYFPG